MGIYPPQHSPFFKLYASDIGVTAPHDATLTVSAPALTSLPVGTVEMRGANGLDVMFYGDTENSKFKYEVLYYYRAQTGPAHLTPSDVIYLPAIVCTAAVDNVLGAETGLLGEYVTNSQLFADTLLASMALGYHGQGLNDLHYGTTPGAATAEIAGISNSTADGIAMLHLRKITADWVRVHIYKGAATSYVTANALVRRLYE